MAGSLSTLDRIKTAIAKAASVEDVCDLRNKSEAIRVYSRTQADAKHIEREAIRIRLRAERRIGELLSSTVKRGSKSKPGLHLPRGISRPQSSAWQRIARLPDREFEKHLASTNPTTKGLVKLATQLERKRRQRGGPSAGHNILTGDMGQLWDELKNSSVDLFLTDPPYQQLVCYEKLAKLAAIKLKQGALCLAYCGISNLPQVLQVMGEHLTYHWTFAIKYAGQHRPIYPRKIQNAWQPVIMFSRGQATHGFIVDHLHGKDNETDLHIWQHPQSESEYLIDKLTAPGQLVVDPFAGSGTTLAAAKKLSRRYLGVEINPSTARGARRRVAA